MSLEVVQSLLSKHKLVEGMVHNQHMPRQEIVETLLHRQHLVELEAVLGGQSAAEIGHMLLALPAGDARLVWQSVPVERQSDVFWEVPDIRERVGPPPAESSKSQILAFELVGGRLTQVNITQKQDLEGLKPIWIDLINTSATKRAGVGEFFGLELPDPGDATNLEVSSRFQLSEQDDMQLHSNFLLDREGDSRSVPVAFFLHRGILFSLRDEELPVFRLQRIRARNRPHYAKDCYSVLLALYGADVEYSADSLEDIYRTLSRVGKQVLSKTMSDQDAAAVLADIAEEEDLNGRIRSNILDTQRALAFLMQSRVLSKGQVSEIKQILRNIDSLNSHTSFLFDKINFLMDATIGFININQNRRVSQLTVFGVVFMPINIMAGIGGMSEFSMMTDGVPWPLSYGGLLIGMGLVGWGTYAALRALERRKIRREPGDRIFQL